MAEREKLIKLLQEYTDDNNGGGSNYGRADYLLENGVTVLPCKAGDTVWYITGIGHNLIKSAVVKEAIVDENGIKDLYVRGDSCNFENSFDIFYLTKEEAEQALERSKLK